MTEFLPITNICMVEECRYNKTHVTHGHVCGICSDFGHGLLECHDYYKRNKLFKYRNDVLDENNRCTIEDCVYKRFHTIEAHHCGKCKKRTKHSEKECPENTKTLQCPICRTNNNISNSQKKIYGLTDKCSICLDNNVEILFPTCMHCPICDECYKKM